MRGAIKDLGQTRGPRRFIRSRLPGECVLGGAPFGAAGNRPQPRGGGAPIRFATPLWLISLPRGPEFPRPSVVSVVRTMSPCVPVDQAGGENRPFWARLPLMGAIAVDFLPFSRPDPICVAE